MIPMDKMKCWSEVEYKIKAKKKETQDLGVGVRKNYPYSDRQCLNKKEEFVEPALQPTNKTIQKNKAILIMWLVCGLTQKKHQLILMPLTNQAFTHQLYNILQFSVVAYCTCLNIFDQFICIHAKAG